MPSIAVLDDYQRVALRSADWSAVAARAGVTVFDTPFRDADDLVAALQAFDVVVAMRERTPFPRDVLHRLPSLRLLVTTGMRNAAIDVAAATELGVVVCGTPNSEHAAPEHTWAVLMALVRHIPTEDANVRAGRWQTTVGRELAGQTIGLLGLGRIGQRIAAYAQVFGMRVAAWSQNLTAEIAGAHGAALVDRDTLFAGSDIVSIHLKLSDRTRGLVGARELELLGPDGLLVNTSRGPIVDENALVAALRDGRLGGAALDVFDQEPLPPDHPLRTVPNTVLTPHLGYVTSQQYATFFTGVVEDIVAWLDASPIREL